MAKKNVEKKMIAGQKTPLQIVKEKFGDKKSLITKLMAKLERPDGESKSDFEKRMMKVSSQKLLNLDKRADEVKKLGGRKVLIDAIHNHQARLNAKKSDTKVDASYKTHLEKKTLGDLLDKYQSIQLTLGSK